jgi:hypothetical protein
MVDAGVRQVLGQTIATVQADSKAQPIKTLQHAHDNLAKAL